MVCFAHFRYMIFLLLGTIYHYIHLSVLLAWPCFSLLESLDSPPEATNVTLISQNGHVFTIEKHFASKSKVFAVQMEERWQSNNKISVLLPTFWLNKVLYHGHSWS